MLIIQSNEIGGKFMRSPKTEKFVQFLKHNIYYIVMAICIVAIIAMITVALVLTIPSDGNHDGGLIIDNGDNTVVGGEPEVPDVSNPDPDVPDTPTVTDPVEEGMVFVSPVSGGSVIKPYSIDMPIWNSTLKKHQSHDGIDFAAAEGTAVVAVYDGVVEKVEYDILWGNQVTILHKDDVRTVYRSLANVDVKVGDEVKQGDRIAEVSTSAGKEQLDGAHVHFSVTEAGKYVDPNTYFGDGNK